MTAGAWRGDVAGRIPLLTHEKALIMIATKILGADAFADERDGLNKAMNLGHRLSRWFAAQSGSAQCRDMTGCDFTRLEDVGRHVAGRGSTRCLALARRVARRVRGMIGPAIAGPASAADRR
jgi:hypothetical protein